MPTPGELELITKGAATLGKKLLDLLKAKTSLEKLTESKDLAIKAAALKKLEDTKTAINETTAAKKIADAKVAKIESDAAAVTKKKNDDAAALAKKNEEKAAQKKIDDAAALKKQKADDAAAKKKADDAAAQKKIDDAAAAAKERSDKAAAEKKVRDDKLAAAEKKDAEDAAKKKAEVEAARKLRDEKTAADKLEKERLAKLPAVKEPAKPPVVKPPVKPPVVKPPVVEPPLVRPPVKPPVVKPPVVEPPVVKPPVVEPPPPPNLNPLKPIPPVLNPPPVEPPVVEPPVVQPPVVEPPVVEPPVAEPPVVPPPVVPPVVPLPNEPPVVTPPPAEIPAVDQPAISTPQVGASAFVDDGRTLAFDTFKNTLALFFGREEVENGGWVQGIYKSVSGFYKSGSSVEEGLNLSLQEVRTNPDLKNFTKRFNGIYALQDRLVAGEAIDVPTVAEYFKAESDMGNLLRDAGMGDLANQDFLGTIIGKGKSVLEVGNLISGAFSAIDNAPQALKDTLQKYYPGADRASIAKAMLMGKEGAAELDKKIKGISVLSAAGSQGVNVDLATASDIAARGVNYQDALTGFGTVKELERANTLASMEGDAFTQTQAQKYVFEQDVAQKQKLAAIKEKEISRFSGSSGTSKGSLSSGYLNRQSSAGIF